MGEADKVLQKFSGFLFCLIWSICLYPVLFIASPLIFFIGLASRCTLREISNFLLETTTAHWKLIFKYEM